MEECFGDANAIAATKCWCAPLRFSGQAAQSLADVMGAIPDSGEAPTK